MKSKKERLGTICRIIQQEKISTQEQLLERLQEEGFVTTQATLSRDIKQLKVIKTPDSDETYIYQLPERTVTTATSYHPGIEFSGNLAVVKTRPGYAMGIASDIDTQGPEEILATIAGDDTILVIPREGYSREQVTEALVRFIQ